VQVNGSIETRMNSKGSSDKASAQDMEPSPNKDEKYTQTSGLMFADSPSKSSSPEKTQLDDVSSVSLSPQVTTLWQSISPSYPTPSLVIYLFTEKDRRDKGGNLQN